MNVRHIQIPVRTLGELRSVSTNDEIAGAMLSEMALQRQVLKARRRLEMSPIILTVEDCSREAIQRAHIDIETPPLAQTNCRNVSRSTYPTSRLQTWGKSFHLLLPEASSKNIIHVSTDKLQRSTCVAKGGSALKGRWSRSSLVHRSVSSSRPAVEGGWPSEAKDNWNEKKAENEGALVCQCFIWASGHQNLLKITRESSVRELRTEFQMRSFGVNSKPVSQTSSSQPPLLKLYRIILQLASRFVSLCP
ncbi:hypothetical protein BDZ45DRAFT_254515 [Acephala macrosclerotiorum]|nr:hypothetical protein BDZ45DRAFT_254515 [Acephala macrosclerotiorum]